MQSTNKTDFYIYAPPPSVSLQKKNTSTYLLLYIMTKSPWPPKLLVLFYDAFVNTKNCIL